MRDAAPAGDAGRGSAPAESAVFAVSREDYRRAFALAVASWPETTPSRAAMRARVFDYWWLGSAIGVLGGGAWGLCNFMLYGVYATFFLLEAAAIAIVVALCMVPAALLVAWSVGGDARGARRRFPRDRANWKQPQRMRVAWDDAGFAVVGEETARFDWNSLYAWLEGPRTLVVFTAVHDPVPVPHAALSSEALDDLRLRLNARGVPREWRPEADDAFGLKLVFG